MSMKIIGWVAALAVAVGLLSAGWALNDRFREGAKTRVAICRSENQIRKILIDEHTKKLYAARQRLADVLPFVTGDRPIPPGFTRADVQRARDNAEKDIALEKSIVGRAALKNCI